MKISFKKSLIAIGLLLYSVTGLARGGVVISNFSEQVLNMHMHIDYYYKDGAGVIKVGHKKYFELKLYPLTTLDLNHSYLGNNMDMHSIDASLNMANGKQMIELTVRTQHGDEGHIKMSNIVYDDNIIATVMTHADTYFYDNNSTIYIFPNGSTSIPVGSYKDTCRNIEYNQSKAALTATCYFSKPNDKAAYYRTSSISSGVKLMDTIANIHGYIVDTTQAPQGSYLDYNEITSISYNSEDKELTSTAKNSYTGEEVTSSLKPVNHSDFVQFFNGKLVSGKDAMLSIDRATGWQYLADKKLLEANCPAYDHNGKRLDFHTGVQGYTLTELQEHPIYCLTGNLMVEGLSPGGDYFKPGQVQGSFYNAETKMLYAYVDRKYWPVYPYSGYFNNFPKPVAFPLSVSVPIEHSNVRYLRDSNVLQLSDAPPPPKVPTGDYTNSCSNISFVDGDVLTADCEHYYKGKRIMTKTRIVGYTLAAYNGVNVKDIDGSLFAEGLTPDIVMKDYRFPDYRCAGMIYNSNSGSLTMQCRTLKGGLVYVRDEGIPADATLLVDVYDYTVKVTRTG